MNTRQDSEWRARLAAIGKSLVAGGIAGAVSRTAVSPLERLKILYQLANGRKARAGVLRSLDTMYRTEGIMGFFKGNGTNILRIVPYSAVQFATYESVKRVLIGQDAAREGAMYVKLTAGASAGIASVIVTYPLDLVRTRLSLQGETPCTIHATIRQVLTEEGGWRALYKGLVPTVAGIAPYVALNFTVYETLKAGMIRRSRGAPDDLSVATRLACGGLAGAVAQTCTFPLDVLRRRMQVTMLKKDDRPFASTPGFYRMGMREMAAEMWRREGWRAFYRGMWPNLLKVVPAISTSFVTYEGSKKTLNRLF
jgi:solute carrier family 25 phosphate transporter 23/24/25/41